ncbi:MAG: hypothetical protein CME79_09785, partial [Halomonas sp.]|nr:hypothetical protein [Halomonas sp.]
CVPLTSYGFLQTPPLASDALASRIVFPSVGVTPPSFRWPGLPASPGKQKTPPRRGFSHLQRPPNMHHARWPKQNYFCMERWNMRFISSRFCSDICRAACASR